MTTIVGDAKRMILVSDSQTSDDDSDTKAFNLSKVFKVPQGWLAGAGDLMSVQKVVEYFKDGKKGKPPIIKIENDADFMLLCSEGLFIAGKDLEFWQHEDVDAIGSGTAAALAVMALGHKAEEAVWAACQSDLYSGEPVKVYKLDNDKPIIWTKNGTSDSK
jgi:ATP-dependent protease HslVU (ClpYQ) peptidase subunit